MFKSSERDFGRLVFSDKYLSFNFSFSKNILLGVNVSIINVFEETTNIIKIKIDGYFLSWKDGILKLGNEDREYSLFKKTEKNIFSINNYYILTVVDDKLVCAQNSSSYYLQDYPNYLYYRPITKYTHYLSLYGIIKLNKKQLTPLIEEIFEKYSSLFYYKKLIKGVKEPWNICSNLYESGDNWFLNIIYPLSDLNKDNGTVIFIPSSHILYKQDEDLLPVEYMYKKNIKYIDVKKGEVIVMISSLLYSWRKNNTNNHTKFICEKIRPL